MTFLRLVLELGRDGAQQVLAQAVQLPQPVLARVHSLSCDSVFTPCS